MSDVVATMSTIASRVQYAPTAIASLIGQVSGGLAVVQDGPFSLEEHRALWSGPFDRRQLGGTFYTDETGLTPDAPKSYFGTEAKLLPILHNACCGPDDVVLACDDDFEYPPDYAEYMRAQLEAAEGAARRDVLVSLHGDRLLPRARSYRKDRRAVQRCLAWRRQAHVQQRTRVHVIGSGVMVARARTLRTFMQAFLANPSASAYRNVLDIHLGCWAEAQNVPCFVVPLPRIARRAGEPGFLRYLLPPDAPTIYSAAVTGPEDALVSSRRWTPLPPCP